MSLGKTAALEIRTPEGVSFSLALASPVIRCVAWLLDLMVAGALTLAVAQALGLLARATAVMPGLSRAILDFTQAAQIFLGFAVATGYAIVLEWLWRGQTVGKRVLGLRVVDERGLDLALPQVILRNVFRLVDALPSFFYLAGALSCLLTKRCQRLGDIAAGTLVIRETRVPEPALDQILSRAGYNSFTAYPHLEARLRQRASPEEAQIALDSLLRRDELEPEARLEVFARVAAHFRERAEFPEEATLGLSDEQYTRNVVDTLFRKAAAA